jgi:large subunit ribosomal protein L9
LNGEGDDMSKEVQLLENIPQLGEVGDIVRVKDGYARNYLFPRSLAAPVTEATRRRMEKIRAEKTAAAAAADDAAREFAGRIAKCALEIKVRAGEGGKLFGAVTAAQVLEAAAARGLALEKGQLRLDEPIRELGAHALPVTLHPEVTATLKVSVVSE